MAYNVINPASLRAQRLSAAASARAGSNLFFRALDCFVAALLAMTVSGAVAFATPPSQIELSYDALKGNLHIEAEHPSDRLDRHYLRRMVIYKNDVQDQELFYPRQTYAAKFVADTALKADPGDRIAVELFCSQGGVGRQEITVPPAVPGADIKDVPKAGNANEPPQSNSSTD